MMPSASPLLRSSDSTHLHSFKPPDSATEVSDSQSKEAYASGSESSAQEPSAPEPSAPEVSVTEPSISQLSPSSNPYRLSPHSDPELPPSSEHRQSLTTPQVIQTRRIPVREIDKVEATAPPAPSAPSAPEVAEEAKDAESTTPADQTETSSMEPKIAAEEAESAVGIKQAEKFVIASAKKPEIVAREDSKSGIVIQEAERAGGDDWAKRTAANYSFDRANKAHDAGMANEAQPLDFTEVPEVFLATGRSDGQEGAEGAKDTQALGSIANNSFDCPVSNRSSINAHSVSFQPLSPHIRSGPQGSGFRA